MTSVFAQPQFFVIPENPQDLSETQTFCRSCLRLWVPGIC